MLTKLTLTTPYEDAIRSDTHVLHSVRQFRVVDKLLDGVEKRLLDTLKSRQGILQLLCLHVSDGYQGRTEAYPIHRPSTMFKVGLNSLQIGLKVIRKYPNSDLSVPYILT